MSVSITGERATNRELLTLGHGTAGEDELAGLIRNAHIEALVDVRTFPNSRRHPQFRREAMQLWVPAKTASRYRWKPELGGFRKPNPGSSNVALRNASFRAYADYMETAAFAGALTELLQGALDERVAIVCSETLWWRCHRRLISDAAVLLHGRNVLHLMHDGELKPHVPTAGVRVTGQGMLRYDQLFDPEHLA